MDGAEIRASSLLDDVAGLSVKDIAASTLQELLLFIIYKLFMWFTAIWHGRQFRMSSNDNLLSSVAWHDNQGYEDSVGSRILRFTLKVCLDV